jgi:hypothetical protein
MFLVRLIVLRFISITALQISSNRLILTTDRIINNTPSKADNRHVHKSFYHSLNVTKVMSHSKALATCVLGYIRV